MMGIDTRDIKEFFRDFLQYVFIFVVIVFVFTFVIAFVPVAGNSMTPNLEEGDIVLVSKFLQNFKLDRNDVVIIKSPDKKTYIKRVVGLPGEKIDYLDGVLYIDDIGYDEPFLDDSVVTDNFMFEDICSKEDCPNGIIPDKMYLVLGDNREDSYDSRDSSLGLVSLKNINGKALFRIWPVNKISSIYK